MPETETTIARPPLTACPLCNHNQLTYQFKSAGTPIVRCDGCGLFMRNPQPDAAPTPSRTILASGTRDAMVLDGVLHQIRDPLAMLVSAWHRLKPGDGVTISMPSLDRSSARLEQLFFFDSQTLQLL